MAVKFTNNARTTLAADISNSATTATVTSGSVFPVLNAGEYFYCTFDNGTNNEIVKVTARSGNTLTIVRGVDNTTARAFSTDDAAELRATAGLLTDIQENIAAKSANQTVYNATTASSATDYDIGIDPGLESNAMVFLNGVMQHHDTFSFSGSTLTFDTAPSNGLALEVIVDNLINLQSSNLTVDTFTAADVGGNPQVDFVLSDAPAGETNLIVFVDGVFQANDTYTISSTTLSMTDGVTADMVVTVYVMNPVNIGAPSDNTVTSSKLSGNITMPADLTVTGDVAFDSPTFVVDNANSRVGIGTASPSTLLDIVGDVKMSANLTVDTTTLVVDATNNRVGIGTSSPSKVFNVVGTYENTGFYRDYSGAGIGANYVYIGRKDTNGALVDGVRISGGGDDAVAASHTGYFELAINKSGTFIPLLYSSNGTELVVNESSVDLDFRVESNGNSHMLFVDGGNDRVGIGTSSPSTPLHVQSSTVNQNTVLVKNTAGTGVNYGLEIAAGTNATDHALQVANAAGTSMLRVTGGGNVGIGDANPAQALVVKRSSGNTYLDISRATQSQGQVALQLTGGTGGTNWIMYQDTSSNDLRFFGNSGNRMTISSSGSVGIGTTSPSGKLHVEGATSGANFIIDDGSGYGVYVAAQNAFNFNYGRNETSDGYINFRGYQDGNTQFRNLHIGNGKQSTIATFDGVNSRVGIGMTSPISKLHIDGAENNTGGITLTAGAQAHNWYLASDFVNVHDIGTGSASAAHTWHINGSEKIRIGSSGSLFIGTTSEATGSTGGVTFSADSNNRRNLICASTATGTIELLEFRNPNGTVGKITTNGSSTSYNTSSDYRLKENVDYDFTALDRVAQLKPARFNFKADENITVDGFLAHEVQDIVPEAVAGEKDAVKEEEYEITPAVLDDDGETLITEAEMGTREVPSYQSIDQSKLVPLLTKAIQEQQELINNLTARIETLEG